MEAKKHKSSPVLHVRADSFKEEDDETVSSPSTSLTNHNNYEELDVNSAASAVRIAIEKSQESIRIAIESVGRKKQSLKSFSNKKFKVEGTSSHVFSHFMDGRKLLVAKKVIDEINEKISESTNECSVQVQSYETESRPHDSAGKDQTYNMFLDDYEGKIEVVRTTTDVLEHPKQEENQKEIKDEVRPSKMVVSQGSHQNDGEKQEEVLELKDNENVESDMGGEEAFEWLENENEPKGDHNIEIYESKNDMVCDDCEVEDKITVETLDELNEKSACGDKVSEETDGIYVASNIVDMNGNTVETTLDVDDVTEASGKFQTDDAETLMEGADESQYRDKEDETEEPGPSRVLVKDHFRRIYEEAAAKERERVKNRLVVERAISEARDRASAEDRERAERQWAAVENSIEEARQRKMAKAREKVKKKSSSAQSKLRAEWVADKRATSEARQRSLEKAMHQKTVSDLNSSESSLRTEAKLDKHNRIMERAAKALAETEKRDRLAQKEQVERNRLAENLDAKVRRWSNGKEGNLLALLSTLQYILGPESGWQPVSMTDTMTTSDVKKAYRKATLCVHPDKLQQWGASIQHKYICEKVFDLLKAAWKRFNSEER